MEEILEKLEGTSVGGESADKTNFQELYKNWGRLGNQEERRKELLEVQKHDRQNKLDKFRGIFEIVQRNEEKDIFRSHSKVNYTPNTYVAGFIRKQSYYNNVLMLSEWMIEKPEDFHDNWYITPCPKGKRVLVVANYGITKLFNKYGMLLTELRTSLPGGNPSSKRGSCTVLDCFYDEKINTLHVLDLLAWNNQPMTDCDTEFRHFWIQSQFNDLQHLNVQNKLNKVIFNLLPKVPCTPESLNIFMMTYPAFKDNSPGLDGLLFYHKKAHYISGETPLVGWLFPYMVQEVIGSDVTVHPKYMDDKPIDYVDQPSFIQKFEAKNSKKRNRNSNREMNTSDSNLDTNKSNKNKNNQGNEMDAEEAVKETETMDSESGVDTNVKNEPEAENGISPKEEDPKDNMEAEDSKIINEPEAENGISPKEEDPKENMEAEDSKTILSNNN